MYLCGGGPAARGQFQSAAHASLTWESDFEAARRQSAESEVPLFVDFTGYACTNCRWMEANMFPRPEVRSLLEQYVRVQLYTDGQGERYERVPGGHKPA